MTFTWTAFLCFAGVDDDALFRESVQPLLIAKCLACHCAERAEGRLRLDTRAELLKGGERGSAVSLERPESSLLLHAIHRVKPDLQMPPKEKLSLMEIAALERWIRAGAPWPEKAALKAPIEKPSKALRIGDAWSDPHNPIATLFNGKRLDLWSFRVVRRATPINSRGRTPLDALAEAKRESASLVSAPEADRRTLLRRLSFDLVGLPPSPEDVDAFQRDESPDAYERAVDRFLGSRGYGEHRARVWLDAVRYSDSNGFDWDEFRPQAWRFRDYVIRSFNDDKPIDRLIVEHLAGDELLSGPPKDRGEQDALIATGYLRLGPQDNSAALFNEQPRARAELLSDLVETTGSAFLGLSFSCCRCHDHKHDPLSQADYYRFRAFFEGVKYGDDVSIDLGAEQERKRKGNDAIDQQIRVTTASIERLTKKAKEAIKQRKLAKLSAADQMLVKEGAKDDKKRKKLLKEVEANAKEVSGALSPWERTELERLENEVGRLKGSKAPPTLALLMTEDGAPPATHVLAGGDYKAQKQVVEPGVPSAFDPNDYPIDRCANSKSSGRRTALAKWITSPGNPLTARVFVNRVWQGLFGRGLVATPDDFGYAGARPEDAELLDWLAAEFIRQEWSVKRLVRLIVCSAIYREQPHSGSAEASILQGRRGRRLTAEQLRDNLLAVSGLLTSKSGGPPIWPELPAEILQANPAFLDDNATKTKGWYPSPEAEQFCRSVFLVQKRTVRVPFMEAFDLPENNLCCGRRNVSTVAPQALSLMNSPLTAAVVKAFAQRVRDQVGDDPDHQVVAAFRLAFQRRPTAEEQGSCRQFLMGRRLVDLCRALVNTNEFIYLD